MSGKLTRGAAAFSLLAIFSCAQAQESDEPGDLRPYQTWDEAMQPLVKEGTLSDPASQCIPVARLDTMKDNPVREQAQTIMDIMNRTPLTKELADSFRESDGKMCFVDFNQVNAGASLRDASATYDARFNAITLNTRFPQACNVAFGVHELQHAVQQAAGITTPASNLAEEDLRALVTAKEADANVIQFLGAWMLAHPGRGAEPYPEAFSCLRDLPRQLPYKRDMALLVETIAALKPDWLDDGQAARALYERIYADPQFQRIYGDSQTFSISCRDGECDDSERRLSDFGINIDDLGRLHFSSDYRALPVPPRLN